MEVVIRSLGCQPYQPVWLAMQRFTESRHAETADELWILEHRPVFTQGLAGNAEHVLEPDSIQVIGTDRGGQVTFHGPGQLIVYTLIDLRRKKLGARGLVNILERSIIAVLRLYGLVAESKRDAPGVYVKNEKIASIGLRIRRGCSYHGLSLNVAMDLSPFRKINPCGYAGLRVTQLADLGGPDKPFEVAIPLLDQLVELLDYSVIHNANGFPGQVVESSKKAEL